MWNLRKVIVVGVLVLLLTTGLTTGDNETIKTKIKQLTPADNISVSDPTWSPDGKQISYVCEMDMIQGTNEGLGSIWVMDFDGSNQRQVSPKEKWDGDGKNEVAGGTSYVSPCWSPDGKCLLVYVEFDSFMKKGRLNGTDYIYSWDGGDAVIDITTKTLEKVVENNPPHHSRDKYAIWEDKGHKVKIVDDGEESPRQLRRRSIDEKITKDSKGQFFIKEHEDKTDKDNPKIIKDFYMRNRKNEEILLGKNFSGDLLWSPDKKRVAFITDYDVENMQAFYLMNADGSNLTKVLNMPKEWTEPDWSPDGTKLLFEGKEKDESNIYLITIEEETSGKKDK